MAARRFDHLAVELSVAAGELAPRYALWLRLQELGLDPLALERDDVVRFVDAHLTGFLVEHDLVVAPRALRRLATRVRRFDPDRPSPEQVIERLFGSGDRARR